MKVVAVSSLGQDEVYRSVASGQYELVLITPETLLLSRKWREMLTNEVYSNCLGAVVVDEAHTVKTW